ncbi:hypothetical protein [Glaciibacter psychrotolerans]|uniref:Uncharacterized protein n=1 Tax=Glaciibacter psychrotolerans TaxID=670054 RepID=A0A7Z0ECR9_9MICO|nr:hypothetical protein [Leifsonia psychrotolerans]NYJ19215.1 hypothetical protein [Leifsonia psychrotolerans]
MTADPYSGTVYRDMVNALDAVDAAHAMGSGDVETAADAGAAIRQIDIAIRSLNSAREKLEIVASACNRKLDDAILTRAVADPHKGHNPQ